tara:strand:- start:6 stop:422 length:417 start_codon:yes stop_codon:yes gene_type:complete
VNFVVWLREFCREFFREFYLVAKRCLKKFTKLFTQKFTQREQKIHAEFTHPEMQNSRGRKFKIHAAGNSRGGLASWRQPGCNVRTGLFWHASRAPPGPAKLPGSVDRTQQGCVRCLPGIAPPSWVGIDQIHRLARRLG